MSKSKRRYKNKPWEFWDMRNWYRGYKKPAWTGNIAIYLGQDGKIYYSH